MTETASIVAESNAWIEVNQAALTANASLLLKRLAASASPPELIAVVKADGYGHGAVAAVEAFRSAGVGRFAVTTLDEAVALVKGGLNPVQTPLLVFAPVVTASQASLLCALGLDATVCDAGHVRLLIAAAEEAGRAVRVHLKVDIGMGRLGESPEQALGIARLIKASENVVHAGTYTHFATAAEIRLNAVHAQLALFNGLVDTMLSEGINPGLRHAANSAAALRLPETHLDAVRLGTVLYGQYPSAFVPRIDGLDPRTWIAKARVVFVRDLPAGAQVGYGSETRVRKTTRIAVVAIGYADGFGMAPTSLFRGRRGVRALIGRSIGRDNPQVLLGGRMAPVLGRIAMQMVVVDASKCPAPVQPGDIAEIPMRRLAASSRLPRICI